MTTRLRHDVRFCIPMKVFVDKDGDVLGPFTTKNLSKSGMYLQVPPAAWKAGDTLTLRIAYRFGDLEVSAQVMHLREDGMGLQFINPSNIFSEGIAVILDDLLIQQVTPEDRRSNLRWMTSLPVVWVSNNIQVESRLIDLNIGGAFIQTSETRKVDSSIWLYLPGNDRMPEIDGVQARGCEARISHAREGGFGVEFINPSSEFREAVEELLAESVRGVK